MDKNSQDIDLLKSNPALLVEHYQSVIEIIVTDFIRKKLFPFEEKEEIIQRVNEKLLTDRIHKMQQHYNGTSLVITYFSQVVRNLCLEIHRKEKSVVHQTVDAQAGELNISQRELTAVEHLAIKDELHRFNTLLKLFHRSRSKLEFCIRLYARVIFTLEILELYLGVGKDVVKKLAAIFTNNYDQQTDKDIYETVNSAINQVENKNSSPDALRKWVTARVEELIDLLNGNPKQYHYDKETLKILIQKYYER